MTQQKTKNSTNKKLVSPPLPNHLEIIRRHEVVRCTARSASALYLDIQQGTMPPPISLGDRAVGFYRHEIQAVIAYLGAGYSKNQIKELICHLLKQRQELVLGANYE